MSSKPSSKPPSKNPVKVNTKTKVAPVAAPAPVPAPTPAPTPVKTTPLTSLTPKLSVNFLSRKNLLKLLLGLLVLILMTSGIVLLLNRPGYKQTNLIKTKAKIVGHMNPSCENVVDTENTQQIINCQMNIQYYVDDIKFNKMINAYDLDVAPQIGDEIDIEYDPNNPESVVVCCTYYKRRGMYLITSSLILLLLLFVIIKRK